MSETTPMSEAEKVVAELRREADAMHAAVAGVTLDETFHAANWSDKPHRVLYDALRHMRRAADLLAHQAARLEEVAFAVGSFIKPAGGDLAAAIDLISLRCARAEAALTAAEAEKERLRDERDQAYEQIKAIRDGEAHFNAQRALAAETRVAELTEALQPFAGRVPKSALGRPDGTLVALAGMEVEHFRRARAVLSPAKKEGGA